jgi:hypothetical protein
MTTEIHTLDCGRQVAHVEGDSVSVCKNRVPTTSPIDFIRRSTGYNIESCSDYTGKVILAMPGLNSLVAASQLAFSSHYPMTFSPDILWITLLNGLAKHVNENSRALRRHFVRHKGKKKITVRRDHFIKGSPENDWAGCFDEFSKKIRDVIGNKNHDMLVTEYSTTTPISKAACEVVLMESMKAYFEYELATRCGIPYFKIEGTPEDYLKMKEKVEGWGKWKLEWWTKPVCRILDHFILAAKGEADESWFKSYFKQVDDSGGPYISGWINWLFPYLRYTNYETGKSGVKQNQYVDQIGDDSHGLTTCDYPLSYSNCPIIWDYFDQEYEYKFIAGLMAIDQFDDMSVRPRIGWAVAPDEQYEPKPGTDPRMPARLR